MSASIAQLDTETVLHLRGAGIADFLQGQLTSDMRPLSASHSVYGALRNPKGRVLADLRGVPLDDGHVLLRLRADIAETTAKTLGLYARFSRIECAVDDGSWSVLGAWGDAAVQLGAMFDIRPPGPGEIAPLAGGGACVGVGLNRWELLLPSDAASETGEALQAAAGTSAQWQAQELREGLYRMGSADVGEHTPQALNYDLAGLVSFSKGCYTGQEVVARLHYRGASKRRLAVFSASSAIEADVSGSALTAPDGSTVGTVMRVCTDASGGSTIAGQLQRSAFAAEAVHLQHRALQRVALPYALPAD